MHYFLLPARICCCNNLTGKRLYQQHCKTRLQHNYKHKKQRSGDVFNHASLQNSLFYYAESSRQEAEQEYNIMTCETTK